MARRILVIDVGGTTLKVFPPGIDTPRVVPSGRRFTPRALLTTSRKLVADWPYDAVSIGVPAVLVNGRVVTEPPNLGRGWIGFDFGKGFEKPVRLINDAAMQALGSYEGGTMLFLGLGTGLGTALVAEGLVVPLELGMLPYLRGTYEDYLGARGYERFGATRWRAHVVRAAAMLKEATLSDYVVLGGGRVGALEEMPEGCRRGDNRRALKGGELMWK